MFKQKMRAYLLEKQKRKQIGESSENGVNLTKESQSLPLAVYGFHEAMIMANKELIGLDELLASCHRLERYSTANEEKFEFTLPSCSVNLSLTQALQSPSTVCKRTPISNTRLVAMSSKNIKNAYCRLVTQQFDWMNGIPELRFLAEEEKIRLITTQVVKMAVLSFAYLTYENAWDGILFGTGVYFDPRETGDDILILSYLMDINKVMQEHVIRIFRQVHLQKDELLIMKLILMFSLPPNAILSDEAMEVIRRAREKYQSMLVELSGRYCLHMTEDARMQRIAKIFNLLPYMELISEIDDHHLMVFTLNNTGDLQGELTQAIHVLSKFPGKPCGV